MRQKPPLVEYDIYKGGRAMDHGGDIYRVMEEYSLKKEELMDFSANINPLGPPIGVFEELSRELKGLIHYPEPQARTLQQRLGEKLGIDRDEVVVGNGAVELILPLFMELQKRYRRALLIQPTFSEYERALQVTGMQIERIYLEEKRGFHLHLPTLIKRWRRGDLIILCNPNNPTGHLLQREVIEEILQSLEERESFLFVDEAFMDFVSPSQSLIVPERSLQRLFILRSLTKFYSLPGLRMGYGVGSKELLSTIEEILSPWRMNVLAQRAALKCIQDEDFATKTLLWLKEERESLLYHLKGLPLTVFPSAVNFLLLQLKSTSITIPLLREELLKRGLLIRDCSTFHGLSHGFFRIAIKSREENQVLIDHLRSLLL